MGFIEGLKKRLLPKNREIPLAQTLEDKGITIIADTKLRDKLFSLQEMFDEHQEEIDEDKDPLKYIELLQTRLQMLNRIVHSLGAPAIEGDRTHALVK